MRTNVTFRHPAEFVGDHEDGAGILSVNGAQWFAELLRRIPDLHVEHDLCQEDWGVVVFVRRNQKAFWIGLSFWDEGSWLAHVHHGSFAWLQWFSSAGTKELKQLLTDFHDVLSRESLVSAVAWYDEREMRRSNPTSYPTPVDK
jgi:hypothetical protein